MMIRRGFSLLEVIAVVTVLGLLALVPTLAQFRSTAPPPLSRATVLAASQKAIRTGEAVTLSGSDQGVQWAVTMHPDGAVISDSIVSSILLHQEKGR